MIRKIGILVKLVFLLSACQSPTPVDMEKQSPTPESVTVQVTDLELGVIQRDGEYTSSTYQETIQVYNCKNPLQRNDKLHETRTLEREIKTTVVYEVGGGADINAIIAGANVDSHIAAGYDLAISELIERGREIDLPVGPYSSVEYVILWQPRVWHGYLPFKIQSSAGRIEYSYKGVAFGEVVDYIDRTLEVCAASATPENTTPTNTTPDITEIPSSPTATPPTFTVGNSSVNIRRGPGINFPILEVVSAGEVLPIIARNQTGDTWYNVITPSGQRGWISIATGYVQMPSNLADIPVAVTIPPIPTVTPLRDIVVTRLPSVPPPAPEPSRTSASGSSATVSPENTATPKVIPPPDESPKPPIDTPIP